MSHDLCGFHSFDVLGDGGTPLVAQNVMSNLDNYLGQCVGTGQCASFVETITQGPHTSAWMQGSLVRGNMNIVPGTAIATFQDGSYQNHTDGSSHAAIYLSQDSEGIHVADQWKGQPAHERVIRFKGGEGRPDNDGDQFYVVMV